MTISEDLMPADRSYSAVLAHYREQFPILDAYLQVVEEHNQHDGPITEPSTGGIDTITAAKIALSRLGRDCDDLAANMAYAYVERLRYEIRDSADPIPPTITSTFLGHFVPLAGCLPDVEAWVTMDAEDQRDHADELAENLPDELLPEVLLHAMPSLLAHVIVEDRRHRNPLTLVKAQHTASGDPWASAHAATADEEPRDWTGLIGAAALDLPDTPEGHAEGRAHVDQLVTDANNALTTGDRGA